MDQVVSWDAAKHLCASSGGHLAAITDQGKFDFVNSLIGNPILWYKGAFVGLNDIDVEGKMFWSGDEAWFSEC